MKAITGLATLVVLLSGWTFFSAAGASVGPATSVSTPGVPGANVIKRPGKVPVQSSARRVSPTPRAAPRDKARLAFDGCMAYNEDVQLPACIYGHRGSDKSVVLFGDSRAMQYFPAILPLANQRGWQLTGLVRADCVASLIDYERYCDAWKEKMLERIERMDDPDLVILGSATKNLYSATVNGQKLNRSESQPHLVSGMVRLIRRLEATGARVVVLRDQSAAPFSPPECVARNLNRLRRCAFEPYDRRRKAFELTAARRADVQVVDAQPMFCSKRLCPSVIGDVIVYKDNYHLTATYSRTLSRWMAEKIPDFP